MIKKAAAIITGLLLVSVISGCDNSGPDSEAQQVFTAAYTAAMMAQMNAQSEALSLSKGTAPTYSFNQDISYSGDGYSITLTGTCDSEGSFSYTGSIVFTSYTDAATGIILSGTVTTSYSGTVDLDAGTFGSYQFSYDGSFTVSGSITGTFTNSLDMTLADDTITISGNINGHTFSYSQQVQY